jgi:chromosome segregation ATPase
VTERPLSESVALLDLDLNILTSWSQNGQVSEKLRGALKQLIALRGKITELQRKRGELEGELKAIDAEQARIRQNMMQLDRNSALYQQYVKKLTDQEGRIEQIRAEIARLKEAENAAQKELRDFVSGLTEK